MRCKPLYSAPLTACLGCPDCKPELLREEAVFAARQLSEGRCVLLTDQAIKDMAVYIATLHPR